MSDNKTTEFGELDTAAMEKKWRAAWDESKVYAWNPNIARADSFVIDTPPPTVSGYLHMGHVYSFTQTDLLARYQRLKGKNVYYPVGYDDNGLPTEQLVEKKRDVRAVNMQREEFIKICEEVVVEEEKSFRDLFSRLGQSYDWSLEYTSASANSRKISQLSVIDLYRKGHLYRAEDPVLWDPVFRTAQAQADVEEKEQQGVMYHLPFTLEGSGETITIATTRPELLGACVAVMYHPTDKRAEQFKGKNAVTALFGAVVPLIADEKVDPEKGSGVVMCCTFGDPTDMEWYRTHKLALRCIVGRDGKITNIDNIGDGEWKVVNVAKAKELAGKIMGMNVRAARATMVEALKADSLVLKEETVTQIIPCAERSGAPLEIIPATQWVLRLLDKKEALIAKGREITWRPEFMRQRFESWVNGLKWDWVISRQRFFGVPVPFWYSKRPGEEGKVIIASPEELPVNPLVTPPKGYTMDEVEPDRDVLDTWATSSLTPQLNSGAITEELAIDYARHQKLYPADMRPQAHEIIRTWAFYTIAKSLLHENTVPWHNAAISGWCMASDGTKMSKSKGNAAFTPESLLEKYPADAVRYWTATGRLGRDTAFKEDSLKIGKKLVTKLWNASKLVAPHVQANADLTQVVAPLDLWMLSKLQEAVTKATTAFEDYDYTTALEMAEDFFWKTYCDNYLEMAKGRLYGEVGTPAEQQSAKVALTIAQRTVLGLFSPFVPYITEELFHKLYPAEATKLGSLHARGNWPKADALPHEATALRQGDVAVELLSAVRRLKSESNASMKAEIPVLQVAALESAAATMWADIEVLKAELSHVTRAISIVQASGIEGQPSDGGTLSVRGTVQVAAA